MIEPVYKVYVSLALHIRRLNVFTTCWKYKSDVLNKLHPFDLFI